MPFLFRRNRGEFTLVDALILIAMMVIISGTAVPVVESLSGRAKASAALQTLRTFREQIELYKVEHGGRIPLLFEGAFPQLTTSTNETGVPGKAGPDYPLGPYLQAGIPVNPMTNIDIVSPTDEFPPKKPSCNGGWLYHQETGQIALDVDGYLGD